MSLVKFDRNIWRNYSLQNLNKTTVENTVEEKEEEKKKTNSRIIKFKCNRIKKIKVHFICSFMEDKLADILGMFEQRVALSLSECDLEMKVSPQKYGIGEKRRCRGQRYAHVRSFRDLRFVDDSCFVSVDDMSQIVDIAEMLCKHFSGECR